MPSVTLTLPDISLYSDPESTRITIPVLRRFDSTPEREVALARLDGFELPVAYHGEGRGQSHAFEARFVEAEHAALKSLLDLLAAAEDAADKRVQVRTISGAVDGLDPLIVGVVTARSLPRERPNMWTVAFAVSEVDWTLGEG